MGSLLKAADYRSGSNYIDAAKDRHLAAGHEWSSTLDWAYKRYNMSVSRGIGPPKQAEPLPFERLMELSLPDEPIIPGGPVGTDNLITLFTHWLVRDMEGALAIAKDLHINTESQTATWRLSVSKTDPKALGCERAWGCLCPSPCPYHAALKQKNLIKAKWPKAKEDRLPLFPNAEGKPVHMNAMLALIEHLAYLAGEPLYTPAGQRRFGRHSWRSTGAVYLAAKRVELLRIQLLARWSSPIILHYARLAPLTGLTEHLKELEEVNSLGKVVKALKDDIASMQKKMTMDDNTRKLLEREVQLASIQDAPAESTTYVINSKTRCCHTVAYMAGHPDTWLTRCGFEFGVVPRELKDTPSTHWEDICHRCLYIHYGLS